MRTPTPCSVAILLCLCVCAVSPGRVAVARIQESPSTETGTVVVCNPQDAYFPLAAEISRSESIPSYPELVQALALKPRFLLWVGSPGFFSDRILAEAGLAMKASESSTAAGIISGRTLEEARALWMRRAQAGGMRAYAVNGEYPPARVTHGRILTPGRPAAGKTDLNREELVRVLQEADYLTFTGHGGGSYWRLAEGISLTAADIPRLPPALLATASCQALRLNLDSSIALAAVSQGAAGYAGFVFSPIEGYLIGEFDGLPLLYTWPGVTSGEVIQLQNRGAMRGFAAFPHYFLLGDPRTVLQPEGSWNPNGIETFRGVRTCNYGETPPGFFPIRIRGGAQYHFIQVPGVASASDEDLFYNSRLQIMNAGPDKLVLLMHSGGELKIRMQAEAPRLWRLTDPILDALDHSLLFLPGTGGTAMPIATICLALLGILGLLRGEESAKTLLTRGSLAGIVLGLGQVLYVMNRIDRISITSKPVGIGIAEILVTALLGSCGMILFLKAGFPLRRLAGVTVAVFPTLGAAGLTFAMAFGFNAFFARPSLGTGLYNYRMTGMALIGTACHAAAFVVLAQMLQRLPGAGRARRPAPRI